jgi:hypothetical protein
MTGFGGSNHEPVRHAHELLTIEALAAWEALAALDDSGYAPCEGVAPSVVPS